MDVFFPRPPRICGARNGPTLRTDKNEENYIVQHGVTDFVVFRILFAIHPS